MERRPTSSARNSSPSARRAKKLSSEADEIARKLSEKLAQEKEIETPAHLPFSIDASGPSELGAQDEVTWVKASGWTPLEFLAHTYRNPWQKMEHRISAAKAILDYAHKKVPQKVEAEIVGRGIGLDMAALSKLSDKELATLEKILEKAQEGAVS